MPRHRRAAMTSSSCVSFSLSLALSLALAEPAAALLAPVPVRLPPPPAALARPGTSASSRPSCALGLGSGAAQDEAEACPGWSVPLSAAVSLPDPPPPPPPSSSFSSSSPSSVSADAAAARTAAAELGRAVQASTLRKLSRVTAGHRTYAERTLQLAEAEAELAALSEHALMLDGKGGGGGGGGVWGRPRLLSEHLRRKQGPLAECLEANSAAVERLLLRGGRGGGEQREPQGGEERPPLFDAVASVRAPGVAREGPTGLTANDESKDLIEEEEEEEKGQDDYWGVGGVSGGGEPGTKEKEGYDTALQVVWHAQRDWTDDGMPCREAVNGWIVRELGECLGGDGGRGGRHQPLAVLVPGAGLGRLAFDVATDAGLLLEQAGADAGLEVEANDSSAVMAVAARSVLELLAGRDSPVVVHPFVSDPRINEVDAGRRFDAAAFPDAAAAEALRRCCSTGRPPSLSYSVGDFVATYSEQSRRGTFDAVATSFFLDTASNVYEYLAVIGHLLRGPGAVWVNVGPVQWHPCALLRPTVDELRDLIEAAGFRLLKWEVEAETVAYRHPDEASTGPDGARYTRSEGYRPLRFVAVKEGGEDAQGPPLHQSIDYCEYLGREYKLNVLDDTVSR